MWASGQENFRGFGPLVIGFQLDFLVPENALADDEPLWNLMLALNHFPHLPSSGAFSLHGALRQDFNTF
jgi:hypothetical protein